MPTEAGYNAVAVALVFYFEHHPFVRLVESGNRLGDYAVETCAFKPTKPVCGDCAVFGRRRQMDWWSRRSQHRFQPCAPFLKFNATQIALTLCQQIEEHNRCRYLGR